MELAEVSAAKDHVYAVLERYLDGDEYDLIDIADDVVETLTKHGVSIPPSITQPFNRDLPAQAPTSTRIRVTSSESGLWVAECSLCPWFFITCGTWTGAMDLASWHRQSWHATAAELTDEWIGRTVLVQCPGPNICMHAGRIVKFTIGHDGVLISFANSGGVMAAPNAVITNQES